MPQKAGTTSASWATVLYPESCSPDFREIISSSGVPCLLSPLHDSDVDDDGVLKKPHYHLLMWFNRSRSAKQVEPLVVQLKAVGLEKVLNPTGYARYLVHMDDEDKFQYMREEVQEFNGLSFASVLSRSVDTFQAVLELTDMCLAGNIQSFHALVLRVRGSRPELLPFLSQKSYYFTNLLSSMFKKED